MNKMCTTEVTQGIHIITKMRSYERYAHTLHIITCVIKLRLHVQLAKFIIAIKHKSHNDDEVFYDWHRRLLVIVRN